jgi:hypothetical protein
MLGVENKERRAIATLAQTRSRAAVNLMNESDINGRATARKSQYTKKDDYTRGLKTRGGIDGFRHREETLKRIVPWLKLLPTTPILLEDGAPAHSSRIALDANVGSLVRVSIGMTTKDWMYPCGASRSYGCAGMSVFMSRADPGVVQTTSHRFLRGSAKRAYPRCWTTSITDLWGC